MHAIKSQYAQSVLCLFVDVPWLELIGYAYYCVCAHTLGVYFMAKWVKKDSVPDMTKIELTNIPVKSGIVCPDVDGFLYGPG